MSLTKEEIAIAHDVGLLIENPNADLKDKYQSPEQLWQIIDSLRGKLRVAWNRDYDFNDEARTKHSETIASWLRWLSGALDEKRVGATNFIWLPDCFPFSEKRKEYPPPDQKFVFIVEYVFNPNPKT